MYTTTITVKEYAEAVNKSTSTIYARLKKNPSFVDKSGKVALLTSDFMNAWATKDNYKVILTDAEVKDINEKAELEKAKSTAYYKITSKDTGYFSYSQYIVWLGTLEKDYEVSYFKQRVLNMYSHKMMVTNDKEKKQKLKAEMLAIVSEADKKLSALTIKD